MEGGYLGGEGAVDCSLPTRAGIIDEIRHGILEKEGIDGLFSFALYTGGDMFNEVEGLDRLDGPIEPRMLAWYTDTPTDYLFAYPGKHVFT